MILNEDTPNVQDYKVHAPGGEPIFGLKSFDTETCEGEMMVLQESQRLAEVMEDGSKKHHVRGTGISVKKVKIDGAYVTYRGVRVQ